MSPTELISDWLEENAPTIDGGEWSVHASHDHGVLSIRFRVQLPGEPDRFQEYGFPQHALREMFDLFTEAEGEYEHEIVRFLLLFGPRILGLSERGKMILGNTVRQMLHRYVDFVIQRGPQRKRVTA